MAFTVTDYRAGFRISVGDGYPALARDVDEICEAVRHYWAKPRHAAKRDGCPFCRQTGGQ